MPACHFTIVYSYTLIGLKCIIIESRNICPLLIVKDGAAQPGSQAAAVWLGQMWLMLKYVRSLPADSINHV